MYLPKRGYIRIGYAHGNCNILFLKWLIRFLLIEINFTNFIVLIFTPF